jgi:hypothetical protein
MRKSETVDMASFEYARNQYASDIFFSAENKYFPMIKKIYEGERQPKNDAVLAQLLYAGVIFEYNEKGWIDLHPLMRHYIDQRPGLLEEATD